MKILLIRALLLCVPFLWVGCNEKEGSSADGDQDFIRSFLGWRAMIPLDSEAKSFSILHRSNSGWEVFVTVPVTEGASDAVQIDMIPGLIMEREVIYTLPNFRGGYRVPDEIPGEISWGGVKQLDDGGLQILAINSGDNSEPCMVLRFNSHEKSR